MTRRRRSSGCGFGALALATSLVLLFACAGGPGNAIPKPAPAGAPGRVLADPATGFFATRQDWQRTPWFRATDDMVMDLPVLVLLAADGAACITSGPIWAIAKPHDRWDCAGPWRTPRP